MVNTKIAKVIKEPMHMGKEGNNVSEKDTDGFKVAYDTKHPECFIITDEVGGIISQKCDVHTGGTRTLCEKGPVPKKITLHQDNHFALLGFVALSGDPVIGYVTFHTVNQNP